jgi:hypothetical protein
MRNNNLYYLVKNALSPTEIEALHKYVYVDTEPDRRPNYTHKGITIQDFYEAASPEVVSLHKAIETCYRTFTQNYTFNYNRFELKRLFGNIMGPGAINDAHDDDGDVYPGKPEIEEHYSAILMLTSDYSGGELYFEHHGVELKLDAGDLIMFRGNADNLHGVREVISGQRANVIIFFRNYPMDMDIDDDKWLELVSDWEKADNGSL